MAGRDARRFVITVALASAGAALSLGGCGGTGGAAGRATDGGPASPDAGSPAAEAGVDTGADTTTDAPVPAPDATDSGGGTIDAGGSDSDVRGDWREVGEDGISVDAGTALLCHGVPSFGTLPAMAAIPAHVLDMLARDLDGDGRPDLVVMSNEYSEVEAITVSVLHGMGGGVFDDRVDYDFGDGSAKLALSDLNGDQKLDVIVVKANDDGDNQVSVRLGVGGGMLGPQHDYPTGQFPGTPGIGDLNGDGIQDVVVPNHYDGTVSVLLGAGDGTLAAKVDYPTGRCPSVVALGDLNGDAKLDLVADSCEDASTVLLGGGDGTFGAKHDLPMQVGEDLLDDLNNDGELDLFTGSAAYRGNGDGTFGAAIPTPIAGTGALRYVAPGVVRLADVNGDGKVDLLAATPDANAIGLFIGAGDGSFGPATNYPGRGSPFAIAAVDLDGDGMLDLVTANAGTNTVDALPGLAGGRFDAGPSYPSGGLPAAMVLGDLNGDGRPDVISANRDSDVVSVLLGADDGTFAGKQDYPTGDTPLALVVADVDGDHRLDVVTANNGAGTVSVLLGSGDGKLAARIDYPIGAHPTALALGDLNGDGNQDLVATTGTTTLSVLLGTGSGQFAVQATDYTTGSYPSSLAIGDLNGDGKPDVAVTNSGSFYQFSVSVLFGDGKGALVPGADYVLSGRFDDSFGVTPDQMPQSVRLGDVNGDGRLDLLATNWTTDLVSVLLGRPDGTLAAAVNYATGRLPIAVMAADLNGDGKLDLATMNSAATLSVLIGGGDGTFAPNVDFQAGTAQGLGLFGGIRSSMASLAAADLNGDGRPDIVVASDAAPAVSVLLDVCPRGP